MSVDATPILRNPQEEISRLCEIDLSDLDLALQQHAVLFGNVEYFHKISKANENNAKWLYEKKKKQAFSTLRKQMPVTAAKEEADIQPEVIELYEKYLVAEKRTGIFYALLRGLEHRRDMLVQLSSREKKGAF